MVLSRLIKAIEWGGPATAGAAWVPEMIEFCHKNSLPLDFISTHAYGVKQGYLDEYGNSGTVLSKDPMAVSGDILNSRKQIQNSAMPGLELHYTEWELLLHSFRSDSRQLPRSSLHPAKNQTGGRCRQFDVVLGIYRYF